MKGKPWNYLYSIQSNLSNRLYFRVGRYKVCIVQWTELAVALYDLKELALTRAALIEEGTGYKPHIKYYSQGYMMVWPAT